MPDSNEIEWIVEDEGRERVVRVPILPAMEGLSPEEMEEFRDASELESGQASDRRRPSDR